MYWCLKNKLIVLYSSLEICLYTNVNITNIMQLHVFYNVRLLYESLGPEKSKEFKLPGIYFYFANLNSFYNMA